VLRKRFTKDDGSDSPKNGKKYCKLNNKKENSTKIREKACNGPNWVLVHCHKRIASKVSWVQSLPFHSAIPSAFLLFIVQE
jgi:hypothetical protein